MNFTQAKVVTAMVTPFDDDNQVSFSRLEKLINYLIATGSQGILVNGTTGEGPTLSHAEKIALIEATVKYVAGRVPVMVGTGSNATAQTLEFTHEVSQISGVDAVLVVVPYYNKPNQAGMLAHFTAVADASNLPVFIYNIPGRTGVKMEVETVVTLAKHPRIAGIKSCTGVEDLALLVEETPADFLVYSGEDAESLAAAAIGAQGIISVASHIYGSEMVQMYAAYAARENEVAARLMRQLTPKMKLLFSYPSPTPVKAVLNRLEIPVGKTRLPLVNLTDEQAQKLMLDLGL